MTEPGAGWVVHKFGGTSLADAAGYRRAGAILGGEVGAEVAVVVSAMAGVTDALIAAVERAGARDEGYVEVLAQIHARQRDVARELVPDRAAAFEAQVASDLDAIRDVLRGVWLLRAGIAPAIDLVAGHGELWSARLLAAHLASCGRSAAWLDARELLVVGPGEIAPVVDWERSRRAMESALSGTSGRPLVLPGFVASNPDGLPTTLGRNGSDYSASIFAALLGAGAITIWTDVDGVMSADPRRVPDAIVLDELSYDEAMELAYFGAKVIHPATMFPVVERGIPIMIRNSLHADRRGSRIHGRATGTLPVRGLSTIDDVALLDLEGGAMVGVPGVAERLFGALREAGVSVIMISQGSSEHSICIAVRAIHAEAARAAAEHAFREEHRHGLVRAPQVTRDCAILAAVGDNMAGTPGIAATFFRALGQAGVNVRAIAQGASERNISVVVDAAQATRALRAAHAGFYLSEQTLSVGLIGAGLVGSTLLAQLRAESPRLRTERRIDLRVRGIATTSRMLLDPSSIALDEWRSRLESTSGAVDLDRFADHVQTDQMPHAVIVDCTASEDVARRYAAWLERGIHVVTPNKRANTTDWPTYEHLRRRQRAARTHYLYETTVGAGLPILHTLRELIETGDVIEAVEGVLSGTLSHLFHAFDGTRAFSAIVREARDKGYTEPDPREDLSGADVARKVVILGREMGLRLELGDVEVEPLVPTGPDDTGVEAFLDGLTALDGEMARRVADAERCGSVLRFVGRVDAAGRASVGLRRYPRDHAFARTRGNDNVVEFRTRRYRERPLVVQGPGAGPEVTSAGVFAGLLRLAAYLGAAP